MPTVEVRPNRQAACCGLLASMTSILPLSKLELILPNTSKAGLLLGRSLPKRRSSTWQAKRRRRQTGYGSAPLRNVEGLLICCLFHRTPQRQQRRTAIAVPLRAALLGMLLICWAAAPVHHTTINPPHRTDRRQNHPATAQAELQRQPIAATWTASSNWAACILSANQKTSNGPSTGKQAADKGHALAAVSLAFVYRARQPGTPTTRR